MINSPYAAKLLKVLQGSVAGQLLLLLISPVLTRLYSPADFGVYAFYLNAIAILVVVGSLRLELAIPKCKTTSEATKLASLAIVSSLTIGFLFTPIIYLLWGWLGSLGYLEPIIVRYWWVLPLGLILGSVSNVLLSWAAYFRMYRVIGQSRFFQSLGTAAVQLVFPLLMLGPIGLVLGAVLNHAGGISRVVGVYFTKLRRIEFDSFSALSDRLKKYRMYPLYVVPSGILSRVSVHAPIMLIMFFYGAAVAGYMLLASRLLSLPSVMLGRMIALPFIQEFGRAQRKGDSALRVFKVTLFLLFVPSIAMGGVVFYFGEWIFGLVFGREWEASAKYGVWLLPLFMAQAVSTPFMQAMAVSGNGVRQLGLDFARLVVILASLLVPYYLGSEVKVALLIYSWASFFMYMTFVISAYRLSR